MDSCNGNLGSLEETLAAYKARSGIEAMFKDCKSGGYNLEGSKASVECLTRLVLLIAISYTLTALQGLKIKQLGQQKYINRLQELGRVSDGVTRELKARLNQYHSPLTSVKKRQLITFSSHQLLS